MTRPRWALALVAGAGIGLAACSSSPSPMHSTTTTTTHHHATSNSSTTTSTSSPTTTSSTAVAAAPCDCPADAEMWLQAAAGTITGVVTVTNTATTACTVNGYPTLSLYSGSGAPLTVTMVNGLSVSVTPQAGSPPSSVTIAPSSTAQFAYQFSDVPVGAETSCPMSEQATTTLPGATASSAYFPLAIDPCNNGTIRVSPVYKPA